VNVTSIMGRLTQACHGFYSASKHALAALSEALAAEMKPFGVRVAIVEPGVVVTPIWGKGGIEMPAEHAYKAPLGRLLHLFDAQCDDGTLPDAVARVILEAATVDSPRLHWLAGEDALAMMCGRDRLAPEEWIDWQAQPDTSAFLRQAEQLFEADLFHKPSLHSRRKNNAAGV
jgi:NAD(P)-dependent dehydrogenase (short-subunit alcohol dehydrogenase family)